MTLTSRLIVAPLLSLALLACQGSELERPIGSDTTADSTDTDTAETTDTTTDTGADPCDDPANKVLTWSLITEGGELDGTDITLTAADELAAYADTPGFQVDVVAEVACIGAGETIRLVVDGNTVAQGLTVVDDDMVAGIRFMAVTISSSDEPVVATVSVDVDGTVIAVDKTITTDFEGCEFDLTVAQGDEGCAALTTVAGVLGVEVSVALTEGTCDQAEVTYTFGGTTATVEATDLDPDGKATLFVPLGDDDASVEGDLQITATVLHPTTDLLGASKNATVTVDNVAPTIALDALADPFTPADDADTDLAGLQLVLTGTTDLADSDTLELFVDDASVATGNPAGGVFSFPALTFDTNTVIEVRVLGTDGCGQTSDTSATVNILVDVPAISIVTPAADATLLAVDDGDADTADTYETSFSVMVSNAADGATVTVTCANITAPGLTETVGTATVDTASATTDVPVVLNTATLGTSPTCFASVDQPVETDSASVSFTIALPAPTLTLTAPDADVCVTSGTVTVAGASTGLDGQAISVVLSGQGAVTTTGTAGADAYSVAADVSGVPDGDYTLTVDATDANGNVVSATQTAPTVAISVDASGPTLAFTAPATSVNLGSDSDPGTDGYQTDVVVMVTDAHAAGGGVTLSVNGTDLDPITVAAGATSVTFEDVTLVGGANTLTASGADGCGNPATAVSQTTTLTVDGPTVAIAAPAEDGVTGDDLVTIDATVTPPAGGGSAALATVTLLKDDGTGTFVDTGRVPVGDGTGNFSFLLVPLTPDSDNIFRVDATLNGADGMSDVRTITQKSAVPTITITVPMGGARNLTSAGCDATAFPTGDCQVDAQVTTTDVEDGQEATLSVDCGAGPVTATATVSSDAATFEDVILTDGATCTVDATVTDVIDQVADAPTVTVTVDRTAPTVVLTSPSSAALTSADDNDFGVDGIQHPIRTTLGGVNVGTTVTVVIDDGTAATTLTMDTATDTRTSGTELLDFGNFEFTDGAYTINASVTDAAGNPASVEFMLTVNTTTIDLQIQAPAFTGTATCSDATPCDVGFCNAGACYDPFGNNDPKQLVVYTDGLDTDTPNNLRVCSDAPELAGGTACSSGDGATYFQVAEFSVTALGAGAYSVDGLLPEGYQTLVVEGLASPDGPYLSSLGEADVEYRFRRVYVDTVAPVLTDISFPGDVEDPTGTLNAAEQSSPGKFALSVTSDSEGTVEVYVRDVSIGVFDIVAGANVIEIPLPEGDAGNDEGIEVYAVVTDLGENPSLSRVEGATVLLVTVDTVAPTLSITTPAFSPLNANSNHDVLVSSDAEGQTVTLTDVLDGVSTEYTGTVTLEEVLFDDATFNILVDGTHTLTATVSDVAGNSAMAASDPTEILVDRTPPTAAITSPADSSMLTEADDADPATPGFQVPVDFTTGAGATIWRLERQSGCDASFMNCNEPVEVATDTVTNPDGAEPQVLVSLVVDAPTTYQRIILTSVDDVGNTFTDSVDLTVTAADCLVAFSGLPTGDWYNATACATGDSCATADVVITVEITGVCDPIDTIELRDGATVLGSAPLGTGTISFDLTITDGDSLDLQGVALNGGTEVGSTGVQPRSVDLTPPVATFEAANVGGFMTTAEGDSVVYNAAMDENPPLAGMQFNAQAVLSDTNLQMGHIVSLTATGSAGTTDLTPSNVTIPFTLPAGTPRTQPFLDLTLLDNDTYEVELEITDAAGNPASSSFTATVNISRPGEPVINQVIVVSKSRFRTHIRFTSSDDGAGGTVERYETRYSANPIDKDNFDLACDGRDLGTLSVVPDPIGPGTALEWRLAGPVPLPLDDPCKYTATIQGPQDPDTVRWYYAIRAVDTAGNVSVLGTASKGQTTYGEAWLQQGTIDFDAEALFGAGVGPLITLGGRILGDLNGDGRDDVIVGFDQPNAFCVFYGPLVPDSDVDALEGANWRCQDRSADFFSGEAMSKLASNVERAGDINGDGMDDFVVTGRFSTTMMADCNRDPIDGNECEVGEGFALYYLGRAGDITALDLANPNIRVRGLALNVNPGTSYVAGCGAGDFNGDGADDLGFGQPTLNKVHVMAGDLGWDASTSIDVDMTDPTAPIEHTIFTIRSNYLNSPTGTGGQFANRCTTAGDVLTAGASAGKGDLLVRQQGNNPQVHVFAGRSFVGGDEICITSLFGPPTATCDGLGNATNVRLQQDAGNTIPGGTTVAGFAGTFESAQLTRDTMPDILITHSRRRPATSGINPNCASEDDVTCGKSIYIFDGSKLNGAVGGVLRVNSGQGSPATDDFWVGTNGTVLRSPISSYGFYGSARPVGNWDQYFVSPVPGTDLLVAGATKVTLRQAQFEAGYSYGEFPFIDLEFSGNPNATGFAPYGAWVDGGSNLVGRNDNQGTLDLLIGGGAAQLVIIY